MKTSIFARSQVMSATLLMLASITLAGEQSDQATLTGVLATLIRHKDNPPAVLQMDGGGTMCLYGRALNGTTNGAHVCVKGVIRTKVRPSTKNFTAVGMDGPPYWHLYMDVTDCILISKPFEIPDTVQQNKASQALGAGAPQPEP